MQSTQVQPKRKHAVIIMESSGEIGNNISQYLPADIELIPQKSVMFNGGEINVNPLKSIRGKHVYIVASGSSGPSSSNDIMYMLGMIRACRDASTKTITLVCPHYPYSRSDKKDQSRNPIMGKLMADLFQTAGAYRLISIDLHSAQAQGFFGGPFDNLFAINPLIKAITIDYNGKEFIIISPDAGGERRADEWSKVLNCQMTMFTKHRDHNAVSTIVSHKLVDKLDFTNKVVIIVDDMCDTGGTLVSAATQLREYGAEEIIVAVTHGVFSANAYDKLSQSIISKIYTTNSMKIDNKFYVCNKFAIVDISEMIATAIGHCANNTSISQMFAR